MRPYDGDYMEYEDPVLDGAAEADLARTDREDLTDRQPLDDLPL